MERPKIKVTCVTVADGRKAIAFSQSDPFEVLTLEEAKKHIKDIEHELALAEDS